MVVAGKTELHLEPCSNPEVKKGVDQLRKSTEGFSERLAILLFCFYSATCLSVHASTSVSLEGTHCRFTILFEVAFNQGEIKHAASL